MGPRKGIKAEPAGLLDTTGRHKIILSVDYGTTYSGVAFITTDRNAEEINIVGKWPGEQMSNNWKTPTRIAYHSENRDFKGKNKWGFEVKSKHASYSWTKLLLDKNAAPGEFDDPSLACLSDEGLLKLPDFRDAPGVCEDYLRELHKYVIDKLKRQITPATFNVTPMECWITLPALWSEQAKWATLEAAKKAGFGSRVGDKVYTIAEPEAAAIATLKEYSQLNTMNAVKPGEHILICDCGGGTVDITTYTILEIEPQLSFDELCIGVGGKCGSTYIDRNLHDLLSKRFGADFDSIAHIHKGPGSQFMASFEEHKRSFGQEGDMSVREVHPLKMDIHNSKFYDEEERTVKLHYEDMQSVFDPVVYEIMKLVTQQVSEARVKKGAFINRIILVGGFGDSPYLNQELSKWCASHGNIQLLCPENPQSAVVRGAVIRGLENIAPRKKQARRHFGFSVGTPFREGKDQEANSYIHEFYGTKYCSGRMLWSIAKGEEILRDTSRSFDIVRTFTPGVAHIQQTTLYSLASDTASERHDDLGVELVGRVISRFPANFDFSGAVNTRYNPVLGKMVYQIEYQVQVVFGNKGDNLTFNTVINDQVHGTTDIEFNSST